MEVYSHLKDKLPDAIENAKRLNDMHENDYVDLVTGESNPSSQVFKLIEFIFRLYEENMVNNISR